MKYLVAAALLFTGGVKPTAIEHTLSVVQRPDGSFDVTCIDGVTEIKTKAEILANQVCSHLRTYAGRWRLIEGGDDNGSRFCDLDMNLIRSENMIIKLRAGFSSPCTGASAETQQCQGLTCALQLNNKFFNLDFTVPGKMTMTRLDDNFTAVYRGNAGGGAGLAGNARLTEIDGVSNLLQSSNDNGVTWASVCDDNFGEVEAAVACRELGFSGQRQTLTIAVYAAGDENYGWDDVACSGNESSLAECAHTTWGQDNCEDTEHVQLVCDP